MPQNVSAAPAVSAAPNTTSPPSSTQVPTPSSVAATAATAAQAVSTTTPATSPFSPDTTAGVPAENAGEERLSIQTFATHRDRRGISVKNYKAALMDPWPLLKEIANRGVYPDPPPIVGQKLAKVIAVKTDLTLPNMNYFGNSEVMKSYGDRKWIAAVCRVEEINGYISEPSTTLDGSDGTAQMSAMDATYARMHKSVYYAPQDDLYNSAGITNLEPGDWVYVEHEDKVLNANGWIKGLAMKKDVSSFAQIALAALSDAAGGVAGAIGGLFDGGSGGSGAVATGSPIALPAGSYPLVMRHAAEIGAADSWPTDLGDYHLWVFGIRNKEASSTNKFEDIVGACWKENGAFKVVYYNATTKPGVSGGSLSGTGGTLRPSPKMQQNDGSKEHYTKGRHKRTGGDSYTAFNPFHPEKAWTFRGLSSFPWNKVDANPDAAPYDSAPAGRGMNMHRASANAAGSATVGPWSAGCQVHQKPGTLANIIQLIDTQNTKTSRGVKMAYILMDKWWSGATPDLAGAAPAASSAPAAPAAPDLVLQDPSQPVSEPEEGFGVLAP